MEGKCFKQPEPPDAEIVADVYRLAAAGAELEMILLFLRDKGFGKIDSIKTIRGMYSLSMPETKDLIDHSAAWSDRFAADMQFRETAQRALHDLIAESARDPGLPKITFTEPEEDER